MKVQDAMGKSLYEYCKENDMLRLLEEWDTEKNGDLTPHNVTIGSVKHAWWRCEKGHEWDAVIYSRTSGGKNCPVCDGKVIIAGENDLASKFPEIAAQWHPTMNGELTPEKIAPYSNQYAWWLCEKEHSYRTVVKHRTALSSACPYCANKKVWAGFNDLATMQPKIAAQWHPELNGDLTPQMVTTGSKKAVWWQCDEGHVWKAVIYSRTGKRKNGCPVCAGWISTKRQELYVQIEKEKQNK